METFAEHLDHLVSSNDELTRNSGGFVGIDEWLRYQQATNVDAPEKLADSPEILEPEISWISVLNLYTSLDAVQSQSAYKANSLALRLLSKPNIEPLLPGICDLLSSPRANESISEEIAEMLGFDEIELVMDVLTHRAAVAQKLTTLHGHVVNTHSISEHAGVPTLKRKSKKLITQQTVRDVVDFSLQDEQCRTEETLRMNALRPLFSGVANQAQEVLPHVYSLASQDSILSQTGSRFLLPLGTTRVENEDYEEVTIPPAKPVPPRATERLIPISELDTLGKGSFTGYASLNRIQSIVYPTAHGTNENMLVCAPTGAGKTDVAMLTILRVVDQHRSVFSTSSSIPSTIRYGDFKIIYVAPMKALAAEIVRKLGKRLHWLQIRVRELTGDMQLTKAEIAETQIIVTTPEKWDVVTRKPSGEGELVSKVKLLIIDEVHLLNEERGAVIETIVARTLRQVESSQSLIRIVGLSATLPNYIDVADFLRVSRSKGLFFFDSAFRPIPLEQHFLGIKGKPGSVQSRKNMDRVTYQKVAELVHHGHQVMVFVHARKDTVKTALALKEAALAEGALDEFSCEDHPNWSIFRRDITTSRNKEMKQLFDNGFGIHHAGMLRTDRNMMEKMFEARAIKVLCCTATLAWGVNLPAHAVIIKGTQLYDSTKGSFVDLSVLDVLQIFGRAGRPGLETSGEGYICTTQDKLSHYLDAVNSQHAIESKFTMGIIDSLNAEISLGTVANVGEAVQWIGYTYLFVRMQRNPVFYGIPREALAEDPQLNRQRDELVRIAAKSLLSARMIMFDDVAGTLQISDLGRIAAKYYIKHTSIEIFNKEMRPKMTAADVLGMLSMSTEFDQLQVRESEVVELKQVLEVVPCDVKGGTDTSQGKVNILLQGYISQMRPEDFALVSDMAYVVQNAGRIIRALLEIAISRKWANVSTVLMSLSKAVEKRMWPYDHPLKQFALSADVLYMITRWADVWSVEDLASLSAADLGHLVHLNEHHGEAILRAAKQFPTAQISCSLRPIGPDILKLVVRIERRFSWSSKVHGTLEPFWLWVEDQDGSDILQMAQLTFRETTDTVDVDFLISIADGKPPPSVTIRLVSEKWLGAENEISVPLTALFMPTSSDSHSPRLELPFLPLRILRNPALESLLSRQVSVFNALQTQCFWSLVNARQHALLAAPTGCGKTVIGHMLVLTTMLNASSASWAIVVAPKRSMALTMLSDFRASAIALNVSVHLIHPEDDLVPSKMPAVRIITPEVLLRAMARPDILESLNSLKLVLCDNLEHLDATYELSVSLLLHATQSRPTRFVGLSNSLNDAGDLAAWLHVDPFALHSFRPSDRDQSLTVTTQTFTVPHSAALFKTMAKPVHAAVRSATVDESAIVFVPSRAHCRSVGADLITQCAVEMDLEMRGYLPDGLSVTQLELHLERLHDRSLLDFITRGIGIFHEGITRSDRAMMLELYAEGIIRLFIVPRESCWTFPIRAAVVLVMGTQYVHIEGNRGNRQIRDCGLTELVHMQGRAVRHMRAGHFYLFCQAESKDALTRFLNDGLPLESQLHETSHFGDWHRERRNNGSISETDKQQAIDVLSFTFLARRIASNPAYYDLLPDTHGGHLSRLVDKMLGQ